MSRVDHENYEAVILPIADDTMNAQEQFMGIVNMDRATPNETFRAMRATSVVHAMHLVRHVKDWDSLEVAIAQECRLFATECQHLFREARKSKGDRS